MNPTTELRASFAHENRQRTGRGPEVLRLGLALALTLASVASAQTYRVLKSFTGSDGRGPSGNLVLAGSTLYGTTTWGGSFSNGVVFKVNTDGSGYAVLKNFSGSEAAQPYAGLVLAGSTLYGTAADGGSSNLGVVFKVNTDGSGFTVLKNFSGGDDGSVPLAGLVLAGSTLYGTAASDGSGGNAAVVFKMNTDGSGYTVLKIFHGIDGSQPQASLVLAANTLYGTTRAGGSSTCGGAVFKVNTDGSGYAVLSCFSEGGNWGMYPEAGLVLAGGTLYGTTLYGGASWAGVVFKVNTDGSGFALLKSFTGSDGKYPQADLVLAGRTLYGTTFYGGTFYTDNYWAHGLLFKVNTDGTGYQVVKNLLGRDGANPCAGLVLADGTLYGTTYSGGDFNCGVVFSLSGQPITPPSITTPPLTQTAEAGSLACFSVEVTNTPPEATYYQWYVSDTNALNGATNALLELTNLESAQAGTYTVVVTNLYGAATSAPVLLSVIPPVERRVVPAVGLPAGTGSLLHVEYAGNLATTPTWSSFTNVALSSGPQVCFDLSQPLPAQRFYRAWQTNGPQPTLDMRLATEIPLTGAIGDSVQIDYINVYGPTNAWMTLDTVTLTNSPQLYFDVTAFGQAPRLYRLVASP